MLVVNRESLARTLRVAEQAVSRDATMPQLSGVLLEATPDGLRVRATDLEVAVEHHVGASGKGGWARVVDAKVLSALVGRLSGEEVALSVDGDHVEVSSGGSRFRLAASAADDYSSLEVPEDAVEVSVTAAELAAVIRRVAYAAADSDQRPVLNGVYVVAEDDSLTLVATDSSRLAVEAIPLVFPVERRVAVIVPARAVNMWARLAENASQDATLLLGEKLAALCLGQWLLVTRLIEGNYPPYQQVLLRDLPHQVMLPREPLLGAVTRLSLLARKGPAVVMLEPGDVPGTVAVRAAVADSGEGVETVTLADGSIWPEEIRVAYQARFLDDFLRATKEATVRYAVGDPARQGIWTADRLTYVVMPWRIA